MTNNEKWITVNGSHILIKNGQTKEEAIAEFAKRKKLEEKYSSDDSKGLTNDAKSDIIRKPNAVGFISGRALRGSNHKRHKDEMRFSTMREYEAAAVEFFNGKNGELYYSPQRQKFYKYDNVTNEMVVCNGSGCILTFFVPFIGTSNEIDRTYFKRKIKREGLKKL